MRIKEVDEAFDRWIATFGHKHTLRQDAFNALNAAKNTYADGDRRRKAEIDLYVEKRLEQFLEQYVEETRPR